MSEQTTFKIRHDVEMPDAKKRGRKTIYPFDEMGVGDSFHVAATNDRPKPVKSMASTISSANARYKLDDSAKLFFIRSVDESDIDGIGARIYRRQ